MKIELVHSSSQLFTGQVSVSKCLTAPHAENESVKSRIEVVRQIMCAANRAKLEVRGTAQTKYRGVTFALSADPQKHTRPQREHLIC